MRQQAEAAQREVELALADIRHLAEQLSGGAFVESSYISAMQRLNIALAYLGELSKSNGGEQ